MLDRIGIALLVIGLASGAYVLGTRWQTTRVARTLAGSDVLNTLRAGIPAIIYFWSEDCAPCKTVQKPAIRALHDKLGADSVQVVEINALEHPEIADAWGVLSLPTTFIVDRSGQPRHVNHGVTRADQLERQITAFAG
jgi:thioredoxin-like negative regulator of GroEL